MQGFANFWQRPWQGATFAEKVTMNTPKHRHYKDAETLFVENGMTCSAIAAQLKLTEATLSKWRQAMNWDELRAAAIAAPHKIRKILMEEVQHLAAGGEARVDADALSKVAKALNYFDGKVALSVIVSIFKEFDNWLAAMDKEKAVEIAEYHRKFVNYRAEVDSARQ